MAIFTAIGVAIAGKAVLFGISVAKMIAGGLAFATNLLASYLLRPKARPYAAVQGQREHGARVPAWTLFGKGKVEGHHVFYAKWGAGNRYNVDVFRLAHGWCDGMDEDVFFYGEKHKLVPRAIIGNETAHYGVEGFDNLFSIRFYDGRPGQGVDTKLVADTASLGTKWAATSVGTGVCYVVVERDWNAAKFDKGEPRLEFILRGLREYDPRFDSTVVGGSGAQRLDDPATWVFTENPAVHRLNYQLGLRGLRSGRTIIGEGKSLGQLDLGSYIAAMNVCDTLREGKPTYRASLFVTADDDHTEILREFDDAMAGYGMNRRGLSGVIPGAPQIPVAAIGPHDLDMGRGKQIRQRKSAFDLINHLSGQFTSPETNWSPESLEPIHVNADVAADGRVRQASNDFLQVTDADIAQYLLQIRYRQNRKGGHATLPVSRRLGFAVMEGEWVTYGGKTWLVTGWDCDEELLVTLTLAETGSDVYSSDDIVPGPIVIPPTPPVNPSLLSTVQNFDVEVGFVEGSNDQEIPTLRFLWTPPGDPTIVSVRFQYFTGTEPQPGQTIYEDECPNPEAGTYDTTKNVGPGMHYTGRATIRTVPDRLKTWTVWTTTADATGEFEVYPPGILDGIEDFIIESTDFIGPQLRELIDNARQLATQVANQDFANYNDKQQLRVELRAASDDITAALTSAITVATGPGSALAQRLELLELEVPNKASATALDALTLVVNDHGDSIELLGQSITSINLELDGKASTEAVQLLTTQITEVQTTADGKNRVFRQGSAPLATAVGDLWIHTGENNRIYRASALGVSNWVLSEDQRVPALQTQVNAQSDFITSLFAAMGGGSAEVNVRWSASAGPSGYAARLGFEAKTTAPGTPFRAASLFIDVPALATDPTRVVILADQFVVSDGSANAQPFVFQGGVARMNMANIGTVTAGVLRSADDKFRIDLTARRILISD